MSVTVAKHLALEITRKDNGGRGGGCEGREGGERTEKKKNRKLCFQLPADASVYSKSSYLVNCTNF